MKVCTFFGHKDCPETVKPILMALLEDMIIEEGVSVFYVGNQGRFDAYVRSVLSELMDVYSYIYYAVVLPYVPGHTQEYVNYEDTMVPEGVEAVHPKYAITWRNNWMLKRADYVVTHITHQFGGAAQFAEKGIIPRDYTALEVSKLNDWGKQKLLFPVREILQPCRTFYFQIQC